MAATEPLRPQPAPDVDSSEWWQSLADGALALQRCEACRTLMLDTAHIFVARSEERRARLLLRAAELFKGDRERIVAHPFARLIVERMVNRVGEAREKHEHEHGPDCDHDHDHEHEHEHEDADRKETDGGLILP